MTATTREALAEALAQVFDMGTLPNFLREADAVLAALAVPATGEGGKPEAAPSATDEEQVTPESLAAKMYSIEYQVDPDSATTDDIDERLGAADDLIAWFAARTSQPVQVEVTNRAVSISRTLASYAATALAGSGDNGDRYAAKQIRAALAALGGGDHE